MIVPVLLCGGSGTRLWPLSRSHYPKQFLPLLGDNSLFQEAAIRVVGLPGTGPVVVLANDNHRFLVAEQLREVDVEVGAMVLEPEARNTAPAVAAAALAALERDPEAILLVTPSDHLIEDPAAFGLAVERGLEQAGTGRLVTFGIVPGAPETGYGYIQSGERLADGVDLVCAFVEKPDVESAARYLATGGYYWNSGIFLFGARDYLEELAKYRPDILEAVQQAWNDRRQDLDFVRLGRSAFERCPAESIDYAVMENTRNAAVVSVNCGWSDLGCWTALHEAGEMCGETGNVLVGDVIVEDTENSYIRSEGRLIAAVGLKNQIVAETADAILVASRDSAQQVRTIVKRLETAGRDETLMHRRVNRPWGSYESVTHADRFQVKRIIVKPGERLSLQMHHHRAEHWVVVKGTAKVTRGDEEFLLREDQSAYIPLGTTHCLENPGVIPLELVEVQTGGYLGEDDIVRFEDPYGRA